jgi:hypothetical protein
MQAMMKFTAARAREQGMSSNKQVTGVILLITNDADFFHTARWSECEGVKVAVSGIHVTHQPPATHAHLRS